MGYFDGAALNGACGVGLVIKLDTEKVIKGWYWNKYSFESGWIMEFTILC